MNIVIQSNKEKDKISNELWEYAPKVIGVLIVFVVCVVIFLISIKDKQKNSDTFLDLNFPSSELVLAEDSIIKSISISYNIPFEYMVRLSEWLIENINGRYGGVGLFQVKPDDLGWIQDQVFLETLVDLENDLQNTQVACYLIQRFLNSGYSLRESFLIYVYGFSALSNRDIYDEFLNFIFE